MVFIEIQNLSELEKEKKWKQAIYLLKDKWNENKDDVDVILRLATECWYVMSNWEFLCLDNSDLDFQNVQNTLIETYNYFINHCKNDNKGLAIFGYMISLFPNYFYTDKDNGGKLFLKYENIGKAMLKSSYTNEPQNILFRALYLGTINCSNKAMDDAKQELNDIVKILFPQNTEIEEYFKEVLTK